MTSPGAPSLTAPPRGAMTRAARRVALAVRAVASRADRATADAAASNAAAALVRPRPGPDDAAEVVLQLDALEATRRSVTVRGSA